MVGKFEFRFVNPVAVQVLSADISRKPDFKTTQSIVSGLPVIGSNSGTIYQDNSGPGRVYLENRGGAIPFPVVDDGYTGDA